jgi:hypothetical protein
VNIQLTITDLLGKELSSYSVPEDSSELEVNLEGLSPGIYYYSLRSQGKVLKTSKLIITK